MNYKLVYTYRAGKDIQGLDRTIKNRIGKTLLRYKDDPFRHAERLIGSYRVKSENFSLRFQIRNSNIETRNNFKYQMTKISTLGLLPWMFWSLEHFDFVSLFRISDFVLRIYSNV